MVDHLVLHPFTFEHQVWIIITTAPIVVGAEEKTFVADITVLITLAFVIADPCRGW